MDINGENYTIVFENQSTDILYEVKSSMLNFMALSLKINRFQSMFNVDCSK